MTHKSFKEQYNVSKQHMSNLNCSNPDYYLNASSLSLYNIDDYERLEFLGDSILNFLIAQFYFMTTKDHPQEFQPKQLHKLKTAVVNNVFLSVVIVQRGIHQHVLYN